jgi:hypothetical protein
LARFVEFFFHSPSARFEPSNSRSGQIYELSSSFFSECTVVVLKIVIIFATNKLLIRVQLT